MDANDLYKKYSENYMGTGSNKKLENYHQYRISSFVDLMERHSFSNLSEVIDYGCGDGVLKKHLVTENYFGIDPSAERIRLARLKYGNSNIDFRCGGLKELRLLCENRVSRFLGSYKSKVLIVSNSPT